MPSSKLTSKGQITIPLEVREAMGVAEGDRIEFVHNDDGGFLVMPATKSIMALKGSIPLRRKPATLEEIQAGIIAGATKGYKAPTAKKKK